MLADELDYVLGVDTHRDEHVMAVVTAPAGAVLAGSEMAATRAGYRDALRFAQRHAVGRRAWAIEGTGSYGAGLARFLAERGELVLEPSGDCTARTTRSTPSAPHEQRWRARRSPCHGPVSGARRYGCFWSPVGAPSTSAAKRSPSSAP
jgi:hypothetical protein